MCGLGVAGDKDRITGRSRVRPGQVEQNCTKRCQNLIPVPVNLFQLECSLSLMDECQESLFPCRITTCSRPSSLPSINYRLCSVGQDLICLPDVFSSHLAKRL